MGYVLGRTDVWVVYEYLFDCIEAIPRTSPPPLIGERIWECSGEGDPKGGVTHSKHYPRP